MQIAISLQENNGSDSAVSPIFGRCPYFIFIDPQSKDFEVKENPAKSAAGGAGIQAAQMVVDQGVDAVISGNLGPKAHAVLLSAKVPVYQCSGGKASQALEDYLAGKLPALNQPSTAAHSG